MVEASPVETLPELRAKRWDTLKTVACDWYRPLSASDGTPDFELDQASQSLGVSLPLALREWYSLCGERTDIWNGQDRLLAPSEWLVQDDVLVFYIENQAVVRWGIPVRHLSQNDPPVAIDSPERPPEWQIENDTLSAFVIQRAVFNAKFSTRCPFWTNGAGNDKAIGLVEAHYKRLDFPSWHWPWPGDTNFYGHRDVIIETNCGGEWISVCSRTRDVFEATRDLLGPAGVTWEASSSDWPEGWTSSTAD